MTTNDWSLIYDRFDPAEEALREALCTLGNGYVATRGAAQEAVADEIHYPGTYLAGGFNRLKTDIAGQTIENEDLVNFPNWLLLSFRAENEPWLNLMHVEILTYRRELDLRAGVLLRSTTFRDEAGRETLIECRRFVHMREPNYAGIETTITALNWSGKAQVRSGLDGRVINAGVERYKQLNCTHLEPLDQGGGDGSPIWLTTRTNQSRIEMAQAARTTLFRAGTEQPCDRQMVTETGFVAEDLTFPLETGEPVSVEKIVAIHTSRDAAISEPGFQARENATHAPRYGALEETHVQTWERLWRRANIELRNSHLNQATLLLRLHSFHLLQTVSQNSASLDAGVPARGLHGEAYRGHIFWDEIFIFPFFNSRFPEVARSLLAYRYRRLGAAKRLAAESGNRGAMYPWQSGSDGREESQRLHLNPKSGRWLPDHTNLQRHVNAAIAFNTWQHFQSTGDIGFLADMGAEMLFEIARFWTSLASWNPERERYDIRGVIGPDEYHDAYPDSDKPGIDNNAYTNVMAAWCLAKAVQAVETLPKGRRDELVTALGLEDDEVGKWREISRKIFVPFHGDGLISQFEGYDDLNEFDWDAYRRKYGDIQRLDRILETEGDTPNRYKLSKQADVLMLFYLFSAEQLEALMDQLDYPFSASVIPKTIQYYVDRTSHGSSLSRIVHSWVLARSDREGSWKLFLEALETDIGDAQHGTTAEGVHLGAMAATIDLIERCYSGIELKQGRLWLNPQLPENLTELAFSVFYHGNWVDLRIDKSSIGVTADRYTKQPVPICVDGAEFELAPGESMTHPIS